MQTPAVHLAFNIPMQLGECPLWHPRENRLYWIDIDGCAVHCLDPQNNMHQLWPLLVHAALFGGGYGARAGEAARSVG